MHGNVTSRDTHWVANRKVKIFRSTHGHNQVLRRAARAGKGISRRHMGRLWMRERSCFEMGGR